MKTLLILCVSLVSSLAIAANSGAPNVEGVTEKMQEIAADNSMIAYVEGATHVYGEVDGQSGLDLVVLFGAENAEGGNYFAQYMMVFSGQADGSFKFLSYDIVGSKLSASVDLVGVNQQGLIELDALVMQEGDGACCPSGKETHYYGMVASGLLLKVDYVSDSN